MKKSLFSLLVSFLFFFPMHLMAGEPTDINDLKMVPDSFVIYNDLECAVTLQVADINGKTETLNQELKSQINGKVVAPSDYFKLALPYWDATLDIQITSNDTCEFAATEPVSNGLILLLTEDEVKRRTNQ